MTDTRAPTILPLPKLHNPDPCHLHPDIPQGSMLLVAPSNSGKTTLLVNLLLRRVFGVLVHYETIHVLSPTCKSDSSWDMLQPGTYHRFKLKCADGKKRKTADIQLHDVLDEPALERMMEEQLELPSSERKNVLIILDDFASDLRDTQTLARLAMRGRHSKIWLWISTQMYKRIPRVVRVNMPYYIFFAVNANELKTISAELATSSATEFENLFNECTSNAFSFFCVNSKLPPRQRYACNFKKISL